MGLWYVENRTEKKGDEYLEFEGTDLRDLFYRNERLVIFPKEKYSSNLAVFRLWGVSEFGMENPPPPSSF